METANRNMLTKMSLRIIRLVLINLCLRTLGENLEFGILKCAKDYSNFSFSSNPYAEYGLSRYFLFASSASK